MKNVAFSKDAQRTLGRLPANIALLIRAKIDLYAKEPASLAAQVKTLKGHDDIKRLRVGDWRVLFTEDAKVIAIIRIASRQSVYDEYPRQAAMSVQIIISPSGERLVVLPEDEYDSLIAAIEDRDDGIAVDVFRQRLAAGDEEWLPAEMTDRIIAGDNRVKVWREHRGLSAKALADLADIAPAFLSQIESGKRGGTIETLQKLASALRVSVEDIVTPMHDPA